MPAKKIPKRIKEDNPTGVFRTIGKGIWAIFVQIGLILTAILVVLEKALKIVAIFIIAISASVLFLTSSLYLFSSTFGLKEAPAFQQLRDEIAEDFAEAVKDDVENVEIEIEVGNREE